MPPATRRRTWPPFALCALLAVLALFVLHGAAAGVVALATMLAFIAACMRALRIRAAGDPADGDRAAYVGWFGGYF